MQSTIVHPSLQRIVLRFFRACSRESSSSSGRVFGDFVQFLQKIYWHCLRSFFCDFRRSAFKIPKGMSPKTPSGVPAQILQEFGISVKSSTRRFSMSFCLDSSTNSRTSQVFFPCHLLEFPQKYFKKNPSGIPSRGFLRDRILGFVQVISYNFVQMSLRIR